MTVLKINEDRLLRTAKALETVNPGASSPEHIRDMIRANIRPGENTYIATGGWMAFTWMDREQVTHVEVSVEAFSVLKFLEGEYAL